MLAHSQNNNTALAGTSNNLSTKYASAPPSWTFELERSLRHLGNFRVGPKLIPAGATASERFLEACELRQVRPQLMSLIKYEVEGGYTAFLCPVCNSRLKNDKRGLQRHIETLKHRLNLSEYLWVDMNSLAEPARLLRCEWCSLQLQHYRACNLREHKKRCKMRPPDVDVQSALQSRNFVHIQSLDIGIFSVVPGPPLHSHTTPQRQDAKKEVFCNFIQSVHPFPVFSDTPVATLSAENWPGLEDDCGTFVARSGRRCSLDAQLSAPILPPYSGEGGGESSSNGIEPSLSQDACNAIRATSAHIRRRFSSLHQFSSYPLTGCPDKRLRRRQTYEVPCPHAALPCRYVWEDA